MPKNRQSGQIVRKGPKGEWIVDPNYKGEVPSPVVEPMPKVIKPNIKFRLYNPQDLVKPKDKKNYVDKKK